MFVFHVFSENSKFYSDIFKNTIVITPKYLFINTFYLNMNYKKYTINN